MVANNVLLVRRLREIADYKTERVDPSDLLACLATARSFVEESIR